MTRQHGSRKRRFAPRVHGVHVRRTARRCKVLDEPRHVRPGTSAEDAGEPDRRPGQERRVLLGRRHVPGHRHRGPDSHGTIRGQVVGRR